MYERYYNLQTSPFENTADPRFFFASEQHREALAAIEYTIRMRKGFVLITGDIGSGKTTIGKTMCRRLEDQCKIIHLTHRHDDPAFLIKQILRALDVDIRRDDDHSKLLEKLSEKLLEQIQIDEPVTVIVDEAQSMSDEALEELRLLSNFDTSTDKLMQVVLIGQPELREQIRTKKMAALRQRIVMAKQLAPLNRNETEQYISHRLTVASIDPDHVQVEFNRQAIDAIYQMTGGIPRLLNIICDNCLLLGFVKETRAITADMARRVMADMVPSFEQKIEIIQPALSLAGNF